MKNSVEQDFYKLLGARIRALRGGRFSQEQLADAVGLTRTSIVNIERGQQKVLVHNLFRIAEALSVSPSVILAPLEPDSNAGSFFVDSAHPPEVENWVRLGLIAAQRKKSS